MIALSHFNSCKLFFTPVSWYLFSLIPSFPHIFLSLISTISRVIWYLVSFYLPKKVCSLSSIRWGLESENMLFLLLLQMTWASSRNNHVSLAERSQPRILKTPVSDLSKVCHKPVQDRVLYSGSRRWRQRASWICLGCLLGFFLGSEHLPMSTDMLANYPLGNWLFRQISVCLEICKVLTITPLLLKNLK